MTLRFSAAVAAFALCFASSVHAQPSPFEGRTLDPATLQPALHASAPAAGTTIPIPPGPRPVVDVFVNGHGPLRFLVESTGAVTEISTKAAQDLGLVVRQEGTNLPVTTIDTLNVGEAIRDGVTAVVSERLGPNVDGVLGLATLAELLVTLDLGNGSLTLAEGSLPAPNGRDLLRLVEVPGFGSGHLWGVEMRAGGSTGVAVLNVQSPGTFTTPPAVAAHAHFASAPVVVGRVMGPGIGNVERRVGRLDGEMRLGSYAFERPLVNVVPLPPILPQSWVVGASSLRGFAVTYDLRNRVVRLAKADTAPVPPPPPVRDFGFELGREGAVVSVTPGSAAEEAGVRAGDELIAIDGKTRDALTNADWRALLARTEPVAFRMRRGETEREVRIRSVTLVP